MGGVVWVPGGDPGKKKRIFQYFFLLFFNFSPTFLSSKRCLLNYYLPTYMCLIYAGANPQCGVFFPGGGAPSGCPQVGKVVPTVTAHPINFLMPWDEPGARGKPGDEDSHGCYTW